MVVGGERKIFGLKKVKIFANFIIKMYERQYVVKYLNMFLN
jgi:hypothetical protein